jgi:ABC-type Fe3+/spermidine/putrescine transport system ATPase subunit
MMRVGEEDRIVVPAESGAGETLRVAVRPEQVQIGLPADVAQNGGSRLAGMLADVVFLGMYTQFHVDTAVGRVVSHRLADDELPQLEPGARVAVWWSPEDASVL